MRHSTNCVNEARRINLEGVKGMPYQYLNISCEGGAAIVTISHPETMNSLSVGLLAELSEAIDELEQNPEIGVIIFTGTGRSFIAGADIAYMSKLTADEAVRYARDTAAVYDKMLSSRKVMIAAVNGFALGGGTEFALACDIRIAGENARFGFPEVKLGIIPGGGGTQRLARLIGYGKAKELILTGEIIRADAAGALGLVNDVTSGETLLAKAKEIAGKVLQAGPLAVAYAKACVNTSLEVGVHTGSDYERTMFGLCFSTEDQKEGMAAFLEKRAANFSAK